MIYIPHAYQDRAVRWILDNPKCALWLDMGLGKTVVTLTAVASLLYDTFSVNRVLIIAPKSVAVNTWPAEVAKWDHLAGMELAVAVGTADQRRRALNGGAPVVAINRENVAWLVKECAPYWPFDMVVLDESSSFKDHRTARWKALRKVMPGVARLVELTGTPSPNGLEDLWAQAYLLDCGKRLFPTLTAFRMRWFYPGAHNGDTVYEWLPRKEAKVEIPQRMSDIAMCMKAEDYLDVPEMSEIDVAVALEPPAMKYYRKLEKDLLLPVDGTTITALTAASLLGKLLQYTGGAVYDEDGKAHDVSDAKLDALEALVESAGSPVLVFYGFRSEIPRIMARLAAYQPRLFSGQEDLLEQWNKGGVRVLLAHPGSTAYGLNMQSGGHIMVWYSLTWSLELYEQAVARLHRQGQRNRTLVYRLICPGTADEAVAKALRTKDGVQSALMARVKTLGEKPYEDDKERIS